MLHEKIVEPISRAIPGRAPPVPAAPDDAKVDLKELIRVLKRRRASIAWTAAIIVAATLAYCLLATPLYTAMTQLLVDPRDRRIVSNEVTPGALAPDGGLALAESQVMVVTSDNVLRRVIARERLDRDPEFGGEKNTYWAVLLRRTLGRIGLDSEVVDPELKALRQLKRRLSAKRSEKAFVIDVFVSAEEKDKAVRIADAIAEAYLEDQALARAAAARRASEALSARLADLRNRVREAENRAVAYKEQNNIIGASGVLVSEQQLTEINNQLNLARAKVAEARSRYEQVQHMQRAGVEAGAITEAVQSQTLGQLRVQYAEAVRQRADLGARLGPRHPSIATADAQVRDLRQLVNDELARIASAARGDYERAQASERSLEQSLNSLKRDAVSTSQALVRLRELERESEAARAVYEAFLMRARETGEQQTIDTTNARVISKAAPPRDKSWPPRTLLMAIALVAGLSFGTGIGLLREYFDEAVYSRGQLQALTGLPVLAALPQIAARRRRGLLGGSHARHRQMQLGFAAPGSPFAAGIARIYDALRDGERSQRGRSTLICSTTAGEGKTTLALNLALAAAAAGERALLVDADFERRTLSTMLEAGPNAGLFDLLEGRGTLASLVLNDPETGLSFLPLGNATRADTVRGLAATLGQKLIEPARSFDLIILDGGAVSIDTQMRAFVDAVDEIVLVVRAGTTRKDDILGAIEALRINVRKVRGSVLTTTTPDMD